jgi:hypothetical protein
MFDAKSTTKSVVQNTYCLFHNLVDDAVDYSGHAASLCPMTLNNKLERMRKEAVVTWLKIKHRKGLRNVRKDLSSRCPEQVSKLQASRIFFPLQCHHVYFREFVVSPPDCGRRVNDFWGLDALEAQLCCTDEVDGHIWLWSTRRGLKPNFY